MSAQASAPNPTLRVLRIAVIGALVAALAYQAIGAAVFLPRFDSENPREVVTAYYQAQHWGYRAIAERALSDEVREERHAPNAVRGTVDDALLANTLEVSEAKDIALYDTYDEEMQFVVTYRSPWRDSVGNPPGERLWFVYVGRDPGEPWRILSIGTGP